MISSQYSHHSYYYWWYWIRVCHQPLEHRSMDPKDLSGGTVDADGKPVVVTSDHSKSRNRSRKFEMLIAEILGWNLNMFKIAVLLSFDYYFFHNFSNQFFTNIIWGTHYWVSYFTSRIGTYCTKLYTKFFIFNQAACYKGQLACEWRLISRLAFPKNLC